MKKISIWILLSVLLFPACKKGSLPPDSIGNPVFFVQFDTDSIIGQTVTAGLNDIYLFTRVEKGADQVITSYNTFADANCPDGDCPGSLRFEFRSHFNVDSVFSGGFYPYTKGDANNLPDSYLIHLSITNFGQYDSWALFSDSTLVFENSTTGISFPSGNLDPHSISVSAMKNNGIRCTNKQIIKPDDSLAYPAVAIKASYMQGSYLLTAETSGAPAVQFLWSTGQTGNEIVVDSIKGDYSVTVTDSAGLTADAGFENLSGGSSISTTGVDFSAQPVYNKLQLGTIALQWMDGQGRIWRSDRGVQPSNTFFLIKSAEPYEKNENGLPTRKLTIVYHCLLFDDNGTEREMSGTGVIAMAYPGP